MNAERRKRVSRTSAISGLRGIELRSLVLLDSVVSRGPAALSGPGSVVTDLQIEHITDGDDLTYVLKGEYVFSVETEDPTEGSQATEGRRIATIVVTHVANYELPEGARLSEEELERFSESVVVHVTPFQREFLASMTNRMGLPPFYLPLIRLSDVQALKQVEYQN